MGQVEVRRGERSSSRSATRVSSTNISFVDTSHDDQVFQSFITSQRDNSCERISRSKSMITNTNAKDLRSKKSLRLVRKIIPSKAKKVILDKIFPFSLKLANALAKEITRKNFNLSTYTNLVADIREYSYESPDFLRQNLSFTSDLFNNPISSLYRGDVRIECEESSIDGSSRHLESPNIESIDLNSIEKQSLDKQSNDDRQSLSNEAEDNLREYYERIIKNPKSLLKSSNLVDNKISNKSLMAKNNPNQQQTFIIPKELNNAKSFKKDSQLTKVENSSSKSSLNNTRNRFHTNNTNVYNTNIIYKPKVEINEYTSVRDKQVMYKSKSPIKKDDIKKFSKSPSHVTSPSKRLELKTPIKKLSKSPSHITKSKKDNQPVYKPLSHIPSEVFDKKNIHNQATNLANNMNNYLNNVVKTSRNVKSKLDLCSMNIDNESRQETISNILSSYASIETANSNQRSSINKPFSTSASGQFKDLFSTRTIKNQPIPVHTICITETSNNASLENDYDFSKNNKNEIGEKALTSKMKDILNSNPKDLAGVLDKNTTFKKTETKTGYKDIVSKTKQKNSSGKSLVSVASAGQPKTSTSSYKQIMSKYEKENQNLRQSLASDLASSNPKEHIKEKDTYSIKDCYSVRDSIRLNPSEKEKNPKPQVRANPSQTQDKPLSTKGSSSDLINNSVNKISQEVNKNVDRTLQAKLEALKTLKLNIKFDEKPKESKVTDEYEQDDFKTPNKIQLNNPIIRSNNISNTEVNHQEDQEINSHYTFKRLDNKENEKSNQNRSIRTERNNARQPVNSKENSYSIGSGDENDERCNTPVFTHIAGSKISAKITSSNRKHFKNLSFGVHNVSEENESEEEPLSIPRFGDKDPNSEKDNFLVSGYESNNVSENRYDDTRRNTKERLGAINEYSDIGPLEESAFSIESNEINPNINDKSTKISNSVLQNSMNVSENQSFAFTNANTSSSLQAKEEKKVYIKKKIGGGTLCKK